MQQVRIRFDVTRSACEHQAEHHPERLRPVGKRGVQQMMRARPDIDENQGPKMNDRKPIREDRTPRRLRKKVIHQTEVRRGEEKGHGIVLTTHSMEEAESVCDRIGIIDHGRMIEIDTPQALIDKYKNDPEVIAVSRRGRVTLEDVFIALTGRAVRA